MMPDIEHLKTKSLIQHEAATSEDGRVTLGVYGQPDPGGEVGEARGGTGELAEELSEDVLREQVVEALKSVHDPEIPLNIYDLGLIYGFTIDTESNVAIEMTLTAPACPVAGMIVQEVARVVGDLPGVRTSRVDLTWDPPWTKDRMSDEALLELGLL